MTPASVVGTVIGIGLMAAPAVFGYAGSTASDIHRAAGPVIASLAVMAAWGVLRGVRWAILVPAAVLLLAPLVVHHAGAALVVGVVAAIATAVSVPPQGPPTESTGGGWRSLVGPAPDGGGEG